MNKKSVISYLLLLITAIIWGAAFSAQKVGSENIGSFYFNGIRFLLGSVALLPLVFIFAKNKANQEGAKQSPKSIFKAGFVCGLCIFAGSSLQQIGIVTTTAGKAGFITGLYIVIVPILLGIIFKRKINFITWICVIVAVIGLYLLTITKGFSINFGDLLVFIGSFFWAAHILVIDHYAKKVNPIILSCAQFAVCGFLSLLCGIIFEEISVMAVKAALIPILYGGICSVGIAYTLQVVAQKNAEPTQASLILSLETVFSALGGCLILGEKLSAKAFLGCFLIFAAIVIAQLPIKIKKTK